MSESKKSNNLILGLDVSTKTIGIALFEDVGDYGKLMFLKHVSPKVKPEPETKIEELFLKAKIFEEEFLNKYINAGIGRVIIEEPLLGSNNVFTIATLLRFNGMIARSVYATIGVVPEFISSYDARAYGFPQLMAKRDSKKSGEKLPDNVINRNKPVLFGGYPFDVDKKEVIWNLVAEREPQVVWLYDKHGKRLKENFDLSDSYVAVVGNMRKNNLWK